MRKYKIIETNPNVYEVREYSVEEYLAEILEILEEIKKSLQSIKNKMGVS
ncbi:MAG: hypothetical protein QXY75_03045 [Candidatus Bathyarchaeia archaeon]